jgi:flagellar biosynthesis/type III secretory pathway M-ring protein FliF/YscJ
MFGFLSGIQAKFIAAVIIILMLVAAWFYVKHLESSLEASKAQLARMEDVVSSQKLAIDNLNRDVIRMNKVQNDYGEKVKGFDKSYDRLEDKFNTTKSGKPRDLNKIANKKPTAFEKIINKASKDAARCNEIVTGSPLTLAEKSGKVKNSVCPELLK